MKARVDTVLLRLILDVHICFTFTSRYTYEKRQKFYNKTNWIYLVDIEYDSIQNKITFNTQQKLLLDNPTVGNFKTAEYLPRFIRGIKITKTNNTETLQNTGTRQQQQNYTTSVIDERSSKLSICKQP